MGEVNVLHVESPGEFYVRPLAKKSKYEEFDEQLQLFYNSKPSQLLQEMDDEFFVVYYRSKFRRAILLKKTTDEPKVAQVFLMDEGKKIDVGVDNCFALDTMFKVPAFCNRCHLENIESVTRNESWPKTTSEFFEKQVLSHVTFKIIFRSQINGSKSGSAGVDLEFDETMLDGPFAKYRKTTTYMTQKLIKAGLALPAQLKALQREEEDQNEDFSDVETAESQNNDDSSSAETSFGDLDVVEKWSDPKIPHLKPDEFVPVRVTYVDRHAQIYAQLKDDRVKVRHMRSFFSQLYGIFDHDSEDGEALLLHKKDSMKTDWEEGEACVAQFSDGHWYRALIVTVYEETNSVAILYVDFGNYGQNVPMKQLRIAFHYSHVPILALRFILDNIVPYETEEWPEQHLIDISRNIEYGITSRTVEVCPTRPQDDSSNRMFPLPVKMRVTNKAGDGGIIVDDNFAHLLVGLKQARFGILDLMSKRRIMLADAFAIKGVYEEEEEEEEEE